MGMQARTIAAVDDDLRVIESLMKLLASCGYKGGGYSSAEAWVSLLRAPNSYRHRWLQPQGKTHPCKNYFDRARPRIRSFIADELSRSDAR
jgi:hypothetical protein